MARKQDDDRGAWKLAGLGIEFFGIFAIFILAGWWLDRRYGSDRTPVWTLVGAGVGFVGAMYHLITEAMGKGWASRWSPPGDNDRQDEKRDSR